MRLLADVGGRVEPGEGPHAENERLYEAESRVAVSVNARPGTYEKKGGIMRASFPEKKRRQDGDPDDVHGGGQIVQRGDEAHGDYVERAVNRDDDPKERVSVRRPPHHVGDGLRTCQVDGSDDRDLSHEVQHGGRPTEGGPAEKGRPVVERAGSREGACQLRHRDRDEHRARRHERPSETEPHRTSRPERIAEGRRHTSEHADHREADGKARKPTQPARQLLGVAEACQFVGVGVGGRGARAIPIRHGVHVACAHPMTEAAHSPQGSATNLSGEPETSDEKMPTGIPFIVANEFAERFCFYGINAILTVYMTQVLRLGDADATSLHSLFKTGAYFFPLLGAIVSDVFWGKFRTIMTFSVVYACGCSVLALVPGRMGLALGLFLVALGTGGIKPCVSTNVGDQFTSKNQHLIERAFSYFYMSINAGSAISIFFCPVLLNHFGPKAAFGMPAAMMFVAVLAFWLGRKRFAVVPPAGKAWLKEAFSREGLKTVGSLAVIYLFVAFFWALWDQGNGQTWTLQAESSLMDKNVGFGLTLLPAQITVVNGLFILVMVPIFSFGIYPFVGRFFRVTPLRKIGVGFFVTAASFLIVAHVESRIQSGRVVSVWWQILAYMVLTAAEVLVSITALEFSYKQAPLRMKSFIMAVFLLSISVGNLITATVNHAMIRPLHAQSAQVGAETWVALDEVSDMVPGQKIDFAGATGLSVVKADGKTQPLGGTYLLSGRSCAPARPVDGYRKSQAGRDGRSIRRFQGGSLDLQARRAAILRVLCAADGGGRSALRVRRDAIPRADVSPRRGASRLTADDGQGLFVRAVRFSRARKRPAAVRPRGRWRRSVRRPRFVLSADAAWETRVQGFARRHRRHRRRRGGGTIRVAEGYGRRSA